MHYIYRQLKMSCLMVLVLTVLTGIIYPGVVTIIAQSFFPWQANGSQIVRDGKVVGSLLIGQEFVESKYFWGRPSATPGHAYNALASAGSNLSTTNPKLLMRIEEQIKLLRAKHKNKAALIPADLVYSSGSGLDPEISIQAAMYQASRVAQARKVALNTVEKLIQDNAARRKLPIFGANRVNVLRLNLALDEMFTSKVLKE